MKTKSTIKEDGAKKLPENPALENSPRVYPIDIPKGIVRAAGFLENDEPIEAKALALHEAVTRVLTELYPRAGLTQAEFGRRMGYSRSQINSVLRNRSFTGRLWNLQHLVRAADVLGVQVSDIISAAEGNAKPSLSMGLAGTQPRSDERVERILQLVMGCAGDDSDAGEFARFIYCVKAMRGFARKLYNRYMDGEIEDEELYRILLDAKEKADSHVGEDENDDRVLWSFIK